MNNIIIQYAILKDISPILFWGIVFAFGSIIGSFFTCITYRIPKKISIVTPSSACPMCGEEIKFYFNIPILSYIILKGKCSNCHSKIPITYPLIEIFTATWFCVLVKNLYSFDMNLWHFVNATVILVSFLYFIPIVLIDIRHRIIPDSFTLYGIVIGFLFSFIPGYITPLGSIIGIIGGGLPLFLMGYVGEKLLKKEDAMGGGDIKLLAAIGAIFGLKIALLTIFFGSLTGSLVGVISIIISKNSSESHMIPFAPALCFGAVIAYYFGTDIVEMYLSLVLR